MLIQVFLSYLKHENNTDETALMWDLPCTQKNIRLDYKANKLFIPDL